jgi:hypothetical protein
LPLFAPRGSYPANCRWHSRFGQDHICLRDEIVERIGRSNTLTKKQSRDITSADHPVAETSRVTSGHDDSDVGQIAI